MALQLRQITQKGIQTTAVQDCQFRVDRLQQTHPSEVRDLTILLRLEQTNIFLFRRLEGFWR